VHFFLVIIFLLINHDDVEESYLSLIERVYEPNFAVKRATRFGTMILTFVLTER
jgi:hypothetical protein